MKFKVVGKENVLEMLNPIELPNNKTIIKIREASMEEFVAAPILRGEATIGDLILFQLNGKFLSAHFLKA